MNTTPAYLFRKVSDEAGPPTILYDEIDTVFGPRAKDNEDIRGMLNAGHRRGAKAGRCVVRGKEVFTEELPAYCAVAWPARRLARHRHEAASVVVRMRRRAPQEVIEPFRHRVNAEEGHAIRDGLAGWASTIESATGRRCRLDRGWRRRRVGGAACRGRHGGWRLAATGSMCRCDACDGC